MTIEKTIPCKVCAEQVPHIARHLATAHPHMTAEDYSAAYPDAPLMSPFVAEALKKKAQEVAQQNMTAAVAPAAATTLAAGASMFPMFEVFEMTLDDELRRMPRRGQTVGDPIQCEVLSYADQIDLDAVPEIDADYVFNAEELKDIVMAIQLNFPLLVWGPHGAGKTSQVEQVCARTGRPSVRVQHTETTEESHITGQTVVRNGATHFEYGPLAEAMQRGWVYLADEYDFAHPSVIAVYQAVLEGKPLYIKEAPPHQRLVKPHKNFRFVATGNTNGSGDDTGLYAGTKIGNAASYSRFGVTVQVGYPASDVERDILKKRLQIGDDIATKMVDYATSVRAQYMAGEITLPISPRELIRATSIALVKGLQFGKGLDLAYANRLGASEAEAVRALAQRIFAN